jgi:hypothetical protein
LLTDGCDAHYRWNFLFRVLMRMWPITSVKISGTRAKSDFARVFFLLPGGGGWPGFRSL